MVTDCVGLLAAFSLGALLLRLLILPAKMVWKLLVRWGWGLLYLTLANALGYWAGLRVPINAVTALVSGLMGMPGAAALLWLELL